MYIYFKNIKINNHTPQQWKSLKNIYAKIRLVNKDNNGNLFF